ncbi:MAG: hypothetical protein ACOCWA_06540 [Bacteroidota bacterium]
MMQKESEDKRKNKKSVFEKYPLLSGMVVFIIIFILLDFILGAIFIPRSYQSFRVKDPWYHHGILPRKAEVTNWGQKYYRFYSNSLGFRDDTIRSIELDSDKKRILFLGDSHTEAVGIPYEKSFAGILKKEASQKGIDILNAAVVSYSPRIHFLKAQYLINQKGLDVDEIFIFIDMSDLNNEIAYENFKPRNKNYIKTFLLKSFKKLSENSIISHLIDQSLKNIRNRFFMKNMAASDNANLELYATFFSEFDDAGLLNDPNFHHVSRWLDNEEFRDLALYSLELGQENIRKLKELCESSGIELTLSVHPWPEQILNRDTTNLYTQSWEKFCLSNDIGFINMFPLFINHENPVLTAEHNYIPEDNHWNENGHRKVADFLKNYIFAGK